MNRIMIILDVRQCMAAVFNNHIISHHLRLHSICLTIGVILGQDASRSSFLVGLGCRLGK